MTRYYGFEIASTDGKSAWFHNPQSALNFAAYLWGKMVSEPDADAPGGWVERERTIDDLDETMTPDESCICDGPNEIWSEDNQNPEWRETAAWNGQQYLTSLWYSPDGTEWRRQSDDAFPRGPFERATIILKGGPSDGLVVS